jgi:holo-[acyl-carrier protein] synthase
MILGLGTDLADVERIASAIKKELGFREMIFSKNEIAYCESKANRFECYAARFAAKEAFFKALGTGWPEGTNFNEVEVIHDDKGKPEINLLGETEIKLAPYGINKILVSLSHIKTIASAVVIIE